MGRQLSILIIFLTFYFPSLAEDGTLDSLVSLLESSSKDTYRSIFIAIEDELTSVNSTITRTQLKKLHSISSDLNFHGPLSASYRCEAIIYEKEKQIVKAIQAIEKANEIAQEYKLSIERADNQRVLGDIYRYDGKFNLAFRNYIEALKIYEQFSKYDKEIYLIYFALGDIYYKTEHYNLSREYLIRAYKSGKSHLDNRTLINCLNTVALIHRNRSEFTQSLYYNNEALKLATAVKDSAWVGIVNGNIGRVYQLQKEYDLALIHYKISINLSAKYKEWGDVVVNMSRMSDIYIEEKEFDLAKYYLDNANRIAEREGTFDSKLYLYWVLTKYYRILERIENAFQYQTLYTQVKDSLEKKKYFEEIDQIRSTFELQKKQTQIELLQKEKEVIIESEQKKTYIILLAFLLLSFTAVVIFLLYRSNRVKVKANKLLREQQRELFEKSEEIQRQNEEIRDLNNSLEAMVQERTHQLEDANENLLKQNQNLEQFSYVISHNLRAPIAQILGLLSVFNKKSIQNDSEQNILEYLNKAAQNLDVIVNDLNAILLMRNQSTENKENVKLSEVVSFTIESMESLVKSSDTIIKLDFSEVDVLFTNKSYLNSILYNLISNAIKYKNPLRTPEILIKSVRSEAYVCVWVKDNGLGLDLNRIQPEKLFKLYSRMHSHTEGKGMGLFIVKEQVESLKGKIEVESKLGEGTTFKIYFPV